ncbi:drebrin-like protein A [Cyprinodon tularosa]|uniref:drebrin-like protein A n=1 Tax=Cyprinodon tularosa TaxID=77115 RepID=UPI0018E204F9|nr:drebrin-like protein A [Cyprinodon tularosa]XP_038125758.1 drebrin-like protein A [Cyprinodon tularosa]
MSKQTVNLDTYSLSLLTAKEDILNPRSSTNWALFTYEGVTNKLKLADSGAGGVAELAEKFHISKPQYGLCKIGGIDGGAPRILMISWVGQNVDEYRRNECATHIPAIKHFFKEAHAFISAEKSEDVTEERVRAELSKAQTQAPMQWGRRSSRSTDKEEIVGTNYRKTNAAMEMRLINRDSFWARAEREEEERKEEEKRRAAEERRRLERERILKERRDAEERDRKMNEKLQMIEEQRRKQREEEEEMRKKEKLRWEQQQREHEEVMRARLRRSESIEKAAEAAALVSQRSMNPREFFRQLSSSSSQSPTSPGSSRSGKPFRRYQRSLTDTAFIFSKAEDSAGCSPHTSPLVSPFSRAPPSPVFRAMSPPRTPDFQPVTLPQKPRSPMTPPTSPVRSAPPVSALPSVPRSSDRVKAAAELEASEPTEPSAPPASPSLLKSLSPSSINENLPQFLSESVPPSDLMNTTDADQHEPSQVLTDPLLLNTEFNTPCLVNKLVSDSGFKVQAVLVEADEEEDLQEEEEEQRDEPETKPEVESVTNEPTGIEMDQVDKEEMQDMTRDEEEEKKEVDKDKEFEEEGMDGELEEVENKEKQEDESKEDQHEMEDKKELDRDEDASVGSKHKTDPSSLVQPAETPQVEEKAEKDEEENIHSGVNQSPTELSEEEEDEAETDLEPVCQDVKNVNILPSTNGMTNGDCTQEENYTVSSLSPTNTDGRISESPDCYRSAEEEENDEEEQQLSKNGQEDLSERHMCVRALYDYQAEDESEISFEPGDIIRDVETVDKAWWRGWSKDGRQGLFPANYVETI